MSPSQAILATLVAVEKSGKVLLDFLDGNERRKRAKLQSVIERINAERRVGFAQIREGVPRAIAGLAVLAVRIEVEDRHRIELAGAREPFRQEIIADLKQRVLLF